MSHGQYIQEGRNFNEQWASVFGSFLIHQIHAQECYSFFHFTADIKQLSFESLKILIKFYMIQTVQNVSSLCIQQTCWAVYGLRRFLMFLFWGNCQMLFKLSTNDNLIWNVPEGTLVYDFNAPSGYQLGSRIDIRLLTPETRLQHRQFTGLTFFFHRDSPYGESAVNICYWRGLAFEFLKRPWTCSVVNLLRVSKWSNRLAAGRAEQWNENLVFELYPWAEKANW